MDCRYSWNQVQASAALHVIPGMEKAGWAPHPVCGEGEKSSRLCRESKRVSLACQPVTCDCSYCIRNMRRGKKRMNGKEGEQRLITVGLTETQ